MYVGEIIFISEGENCSVTSKNRSSGSHELYRQVAYFLAAMSELMFYDASALTIEPKS